MNSQLIEKVIKSSGQPCPEFTYSNPIIDRNIARGLAKSFVKILSLSKHQSNLNSNLRLSILENIRKMCQIDPEDHIKVDDNITSIVTEFYDRHLRETSTSSCTDAVDKKLDMFLLRRMKHMNFDSKYSSSLNPELIQALINLKENGFHLETLAKDIIHWKCESGKHLTIVKDLWTNKDALPKHMCDDVSIKMKSEIESLLLSTVQDILSQKNIDIEHIFQGNSELQNLIKKCSISSECFQVCSGILNFLFVMTNFELGIQRFVWIFVTKVKEIFVEPTFSTLYPVHLSHIVVLLDLDVEILPIEFKQCYIQSTLTYLQSLHKESENDLILLLSHFPQWFDIYFEKDLKIKLS